MTFTHSIRGAVRRASQVDPRLVRRLRRSADVGGSVTEMSRRRGRALDVAVLRLDGLGDSMLSAPLLVGLLQSASIRSVTVVAPPAVTAIIPVGDKIVIDPVRLNTLASPTTKRSEVGRVLSQTALGQLAAYRAGRRRRGRFDLVILPRYDSDRGYNAFAFALGTGAALAGHDAAVRSSGHDPGERAEAALLAVKAADRRPAVHETERARALTEALGLDWPTAHGWGRRFFGLPATTSCPDGATVVISTGATSDKRVWPMERWREVTQALLQRGWGDVVLVGSPGERTAQDRVVANLGAHAVSRAGEVPLAALPGLIAGAQLFVGTDSGPAHIASLLDVPTVVISCHPTGADADHVNSPERFGPWAASAAVLRPAAASGECISGCVHESPHCILGISATAVVESVDRLVGVPEGAPQP